MCEYELENAVAKQEEKEPIIPTTTEEYWAAVDTGMKLRVKSFLFPEEFGEFQSLLKLLLNPEGDVISIDEEDYEELFQDLCYHNHCYAAMMRGSIADIKRQISLLNLSIAPTLFVCVFGGDDTTLDDIEAIANHIQHQAQQEANILFGMKETVDKTKECLILWSDAVRRPSEYSQKEIEKLFAAL